MRDASAFSTAILLLLSNETYRPKKLQAIARKLAVQHPENGSFRTAARGLLASGQIVRTTEKKLLKAEKLPLGKSKSRAGGSTASAEQVECVFRRAMGGYGFAKPVGSPAGDRSSDIHIAADRSLDAASGDTVMVRLSRQQDVRRLGPSGEITRIILRRTTRFVGSAFEVAGVGFVQVDGTGFARPIAVGDPGAKGAHSGDKVILEIVRFPTHLVDGEGVIVEVLGRSGEPGVDTRTVVAEFGLPGPFPEAVLLDARRQAEQFDETLLNGRRDLTGEVVVTIDPVDARDFDDAISLERIGRDHWKLGVHIADVTHFVPEGSAIDQEAKSRGTSVYLPDMVIPMLPEIVSNNLASLQPDRVRYARTCWIEFSADGAFIDAQVERSAIKSRRRFTYEEIDEFLERPDGKKVSMTAAVKSLLERMQELAKVLRGRRMRRGSLELVMPEIKIDLDRDGRVSGAHVAKNTESHQIIEEFMLSANEAVAGILEKASVGFLRRIHPPPDPRKLKQLTEFVSELGFEIESLESRFEIQRLLGLARGRDEEHAVHYAVLRSLSRARYGPEKDGHYALASDCYCHFTSPIRRYPDLTVHRLFDLLEKARKPPSDGLDALGDHCSQLERRAESAERELVKLKLLFFMSERVGSLMDAVVTGVEAFGLFVQGLEIPAEGHVAIATLPDDSYRFDRAAHSLVGRRAGNSFRLGDRVRVKIARVDLNRRKLDVLIESQQKKPPAQPRSITENPRKTVSRSTTKTRRSAARNAKKKSPRKGQKRRS